MFVIELVFLFLLVIFSEVLILVFEMGVKVIKVVVILWWVCVVWIIIVNKNYKSVNIVCFCIVVKICRLKKKV